MVYGSFDFPQSGTGQERPDFDQFNATELYCPQCKRSVPVRAHLLLILPGGDKYEYRCQLCGSRVGGKTDHSGQFYSVLHGR